MLSARDFRELVSGRRRGITATLWRALLRVAEVPYTAAVSWRNRRYDRGKQEIHRVEAPVVSVGNLTLGGTGKTPMVAWIARWFRQQGVRVTLVSRGYGATAGTRNDEALELEQRLPDVPHLQNPDRVEAAQTAIEEFECQLVLLDDAFQHRRIARDLDLVLIDALEPFGWGHVFPRGTLREPASGLRRADVVALSRADMLTAAERDQIRAQAARLAPGAAWLEVCHRPENLLNCDNHQRPLDSLADKPVVAFCGIGNPAGFRHTLVECGYQVLELREFPDHHNYTRADVEQLGEWIAASEVAAVLVTHKDLVKLGVSRLGGRPLWAVAIGMEILVGEELLTAKLRELVERIEPPTD